MKKSTIAVVIVVLLLASGLLNGIIQMIAILGVLAAAGYFVYRFISK